MSSGTDLIGNATTPNLYDYSDTPLNSLRHEIRTLVIHRGDFSSPISCSLSVVSLDSHPVFDALSYVWGKSFVRHRIKINGAPLFITTNLYTVLNRLRRAQTTLTLWIDAICINQNDIDERNQQVPLMCRIYSQALIVIIWLGDADHETEMALNFLERLARLGANVWQLPPDARERACARAGINTANKEWDAFERLLERPWFNRVWVWQELALAKRTWSPLIKVGEFSVHWIYLAGVTNYIPLCEWERFLSTAIWSRVNSMEKARGSLGTEEPMSMVKALSYTRYCDATDPRDKVFALYGLAKDGPQAIEVDYRKSIRAVFTDVSKYLIENARDLVLLSMVQDANPDHNLPSWVPDWSLFFHADLLSVLDDQEPQNNERFKAAIGARIRVQFDKENSDVLIVSGFGIGTIKGLGGLQQNATIEQWAGKSDAEKMSGHSVLGINQVCSEWFGMVLSIEDGLYPATGESYMRAFARTIIADRDALQRRAAPNLYGALEELLLYYEQTDQFTPELRAFAPRKVTEYKNAIAASAGHRRFFVDDGGLIGLAPSGALEDDTVALFLGAQVPFVIRERGDGKYQLIGECYVHGIMDGELIKVADDEEIRGLMEDLIYDYTLV